MTVGKLKKLIKDLAAADAIIVTDENGDKHKIWYLDNTTCLVVYTLKLS